MAETIVLIQDCPGESIMMIRNGRVQVYTPFNALISELEHVFGLQESSKEKLREIAEILKDWQG